MSPMPTAIHSPRTLVQSLTIAAMVLCFAAAPCFGAEQADGAALYRKHCSGCHPEGSKLNLQEPLNESLRQPPPGMPAFGEEKLSDREVNAIASYLLNEPSAVTPPARETPAPRKTDAELQPSSRPDRSSRSKLKGFGTPD